MTSSSGPPERPEGPPATASASPASASVQPACPPADASVAPASTSIPLGAPEVCAEDIEAVVEVLETNRLSRGPAEVRFEEALAEYLDVRHAVAVSSGTSALHLCVRALDLGPGDEVITTPFSFVASSNALLYEGVRPVFVDVEPRNLNIDLERLEAAITSRTRAILPVHVFGRPAPMPAIRALATRHGLMVIEDACEAIGSQIGGRCAGAWGDLGTLSFYPNKQITTGEGGVVVTDDDGLARRLRRLRNQGRTASSDAFDQVELGYSYRLPEMSCALGASQLSRIEQVIVRRAAIAAAYDERLAGSDALVTPRLGVREGRISWFVYVVQLAERFDSSRRDRVVEQLAQRGIECARYFAPIHLQPLYRERFGYRRGDYPVAEAAGDRSIALPFFNRISEEQIDLACRSLLECLERTAVEV